MKLDTHRLCVCRFVFRSGGFHPAVSVLLWMAFVLCAGLSLESCQKEETLFAPRHSFNQHVFIYFSPCREESKAYLPDENKMTDLNLWIFNGEILEKSLYLKGAAIDSLSQGKALKVSLGMGQEYDFFVCANLGYELDLRSKKELLDYRYYMAYPDEFGSGMVMTCRETISIEKDGQVHLTLKRLMSKISLKIDRSQLHKNIEIHCRRVKVCHCPQWCNLFTDSKIQNSSDYFIKGFELDREQCAPLNRLSDGQLSEEVSLYILENRQDDKNEKTGVYIEASFDYESDSLYSLDDAYLHYRFYLEEDNAYCLTRSRLYPVCLTPFRDGLGSGEKDWRIDRSELKYKESYCWYEVLPGNYIECRLGETFTIATACSPSWAPCQFGKESLYSSSEERGMIQYKIAPDGRSIQITALKKGSSLIDIEWGAPINDGCFVIIVCEP